MSKFGNSQKDKFLSAFPTSSLDNEDDVLTIKCKFNFSYFIKQGAGQEFHEWNHLQLVSLLEALKHFSQFPLSHWIHETRKGLPTFAIYGKFPSNTDFSHPLHVPHQAMWARFRLTSAFRLIGFVVPSTYHRKEHPKTKELFDCNTFYVVFLDMNHRFYKTEKT